MEVILKQDVDKIGKTGQVVKVKDGFANNFLIPKGMAMPKTQANLKKLERQNQERLAELENSRKEAEALKEKLAGLSLTIPALSQEGDALYGSIARQDIAAALKEEGLEIDKAVIFLEEPIKSLGIYEIPIKLHPEILAKVKVWVVKK